MSQGLRNRSKSRSAKFSNPYKTHSFSRDVLILLVATKVFLKNRGVQLQPLHPSSGGPADINSTLLSNTGASNSSNL